ncbi:MAG: acyl-CoA thioesterase-1 [Planctomycetota bacterium]|jgi:acyl-CoA thioesterase-1
MLVRMHNNKRILALLLSLFILGCGSEQEPDTETRLGDSWQGSSSAGSVAALEIDADAPTVIFLGDSLSAGLHLEADLAFPAVLQRRMVERGLPFKLVNAGISGDTAAGGVARIDWLLKQNPSVVVVELGANDGLRGMDTQKIEANLRTILLRIRDAGATSILFGLEIPTSYGLEYTQKFRQMYVTLSDDLDLPFVEDFLVGVGGVPSMNLPDGMHPTALGHERLADNIQAVLVGVLEDLD